MPSGASSPGPGAGRVMGPDCPHPPPCLQSHQPELPPVSRAAQGRVQPLKNPHKHPGGSEPHCPQVSTRTTVPHALPVARGCPQCWLTGSGPGGPTGGRIEAALRPRFRRGPWEAHPKRGPRALLPATGEPQGHLLLGDSLSCRSSSGAPQHGPSGCSHLCPSSGVLATPGSRGTPAHSRAPRSPWAPWALRSGVSTACPCPPSP